MPDAVGGGPTKAERERWMAEDDLRTLIDATKIRKDKARLSRAMKVAREQKKALEDVQS